MEHIRLGCELDLVAASQIISDEENTLRKFFIPVIRYGVTNDRALDVPARTRGNVIVKVGNSRDLSRIEFEHSQTILELLANMLKQIRLVNTDVEVRPDRVVFIGESNFLIIRGIFTRWIKMLFGNIAGEGWGILI